MAAAIFLSSAQVTGAALTGRKGLRRSESESDGYVALHRERDTVELAAIVVHFRGLPVQLDAHSRKAGKARVREASRIVARASAPWDHRLSEDRVRRRDQLRTAAIRG